MKYWLLILLSIIFQLSYGQSKTDVITLNAQKQKSLTQESFSSGKGYYVVEGNFDLKGRTINIPNGCYLNFSGGTISNGHLLGELLNEYVRPEWFGAKADGSHDDTEAIQMAVDLGRHVLLSGRYCVSHSIIVKNQGITLEKGSEIKAIGNAIDYILRYQGTTSPVYLDGGGVLNANGICGGIYYDTPKTFRLQNIYINSVAYYPALTVKKGFIESYNVNCNGSLVAKAKQPKAVVSLEGGSDHKFDRWTIVTKTTGIAGCGGSSIFTRVHIWGGSDVGFSVNSSSCTFNMCYTDYCKIGFELLNPTKGKIGGIYILNHNTIGQPSDVLVLSHFQNLIGTITLASHLNYKMKLIAFAPEITNGLCGVTINASTIAGNKGSTAMRPHFEASPNKDALMGYQYFNTDTKQLEVWNGKEWTSFVSYHKGLSSQRPAKPNEGDLYYDSSLKKMILFNGNTWVNLNGSPLK
jgi:hypothetical protein